MFLSYTSLQIFIAPPAWKIIPKDTEAIDGDSIMLHCQGTGKPDPSITWMRSIGKLKFYFKHH